MMRSVRSRLLVLNVLVLTLTLGALGAVLRVWATESLIASVDRDLTERARRAVWFANRFADKAPRTPTQFSGHSDLGPPSRWTARVIDKIYGLDGKRMYGAAGDPLLDAAGFSAGKRGESSVSTQHIEGEAMRVMSVPVTSGAGTVAVVQAAYGLDDVERATSNLDRILQALVPVGVLVSAAGGSFLMRRALGPVRDATRSAAKIGAQDLSQRLPVSGDDEFSALATTFNGLLARLQAAFEQQRRFTADASHELKSPLTVVKAGASLLANADLTEPQRRTVSSISTAAAHMERVVGDLLLLARTDAGELTPSLQEIEVRSLVDLAMACVHADGAAEVLNRIEDPGINVLGDEGQLTGLLVNILDNAPRHTPEAGTIAVDARREGEEVVITVRDTGCGIASEHLPHVFERFYRIDEGRARTEGGTGLGLAICDSIARAHGGSLDIQSEIGIGTTLTLRLRSAPLRAHS